MQIIGFILDKAKWVSALLIIGVILLILFNKTTWQYYPLFILAGLILLLLVLNYFNPIKLSIQASRWMVTIGIGLLVVAIILILILPTKEIPTPSGDYFIGTQTFEVKDSSRKEMYTDDPEDYRRIKYQMWYPSDNVHQYSRAPWIVGGKEITRSIASSMNLPGIMLDHTATILSNSYTDALLSKQSNQYPVVVISHGWQGFRTLHTDYAEELASHGYIVVSIDHTYGSLGVKFDNDEVATLNKNALPQGAEPAIFDPAAKRLVSTYGEDVSLVLDELETLNASSEMFNNKLNLDAIGLLGHSTGGGGDVYLALKDKRITSLMGLDAWVKPIGNENLEKGLAIPALYLRSEQWAIGPNNDALAILFKNSTNYQLIQLNQTNHVDFAMTYMYSPITKYIGFTGKLGKRKSSEIQREFILAFFDKTLKQKASLKDNDFSELIKKHNVVEAIDQVN